MKSKQTDPSGLFSTLSGAFKLQDARGSVAALFSGSTALVALADPEGWIESGNRNGLKHILDWVHPSGHDQLRELHGKVLATGETVTMDLPVQVENGELGWVQLECAPAELKSGLPGLMHLGIDITERKNRENQLQRASDLMVDTHGMAHIGVWEWDITQPHAVWSPGLYDIYGLDPASYTPSYEEYLKRVHPEDRERVEKATSEVFHNHTSYSHDERIFRSDGTIRYLHTWATPILDEHGKLVRLMGVCQDITDRKAVEKALTDQTAELARSNVELEQFAYAASHDLQEPLRTISGFVQVLERRFRGKIDKDTDEIMDYASLGVRRMGRLLEDVLEYSRLRRAAPKQVPTSLAWALDRASDMMKEEIASSKARIGFSGLPEVRADPALLVTLLDHLLSNAIRHCNEATPMVRISATVDKDWVHVVVSDNGPGIPFAHREAAFEVFRRLSTEAKGSGMGLALCRKIVERHGGKIWIESAAQSKGCEIHFTLPNANDRREKERR